MTFKCIYPIIFQVSSTSLTTSRFLKLTKMQIIYSEKKMYTVRNLVYISMTTVLYQE